MPKLIEGQTINNYVIQNKLGDGGMGSVYFGSHNRIERHVAIKILHKELFENGSIRNRFKNEANALIKLNHQNIIKIYDYVEQDYLACLIMEYMDGYTLDEYITKVSGPLPSKKAVKIMASVLNAVQYAHDNNVLHRDIKPSNIMISKDGTKIRIMDFGIAKLTDSSNFKTTHAHTQLGTPFYMSPEQIKGLPYTRSSDIYSLGVTLYEMATGKCPYNDITNLFELQSKIVNEPLPSTGKFYPFVDQRIQDAIAIATDKHPEKRFQSCNEFKKFLLEEDKKTIVLAPPPRIEENPAKSQTKSGITEKGKTEHGNAVYLVVAGVVLLVLMAFWSVKKPADRENPPVTDTVREISVDSPKVTLPSKPNPLEVDTIIRLMEISLNATIIDSGKYAAFRNGLEVVIKQPSRNIDSVKNEYTQYFIATSKQARKLIAEREKRDRSKFRSGEKCGRLLTELENNILQHGSRESTARIMEGYKECFSPVKPSPPPPTGTPVELILNQ